MTLLFIDDADTRVQYQAGGDFNQGVLAVDGTRHGAKAANLSVSLPFSGECSSLEAGLRTEGEDLGNK